MRQDVQTRAERLNERIQDDRLGGLGREKADGKNARKLFRTFVLRLDGTVVFLEDWLADLPGLCVRRFALADRYAIPMMISLDETDRSAFPAVKFVEANTATPPYRLFREVHCP